jgi:hypothetical protein
MSHKPFDKNFIPSHNLREQIAALKETIFRSNQQYADTIQPMDDDDLDEIPKGGSHDKQA